VIHHRFLSFLSECGDSSPLSFFRSATIHRRFLSFFRTAAIHRRFLSFGLPQRAAPFFCLIIPSSITPLKNGQKRSRFGEEKAAMNRRTPKEKKERKAAMNRRTPKRR
jgi:hypothetical protein